MAAHNDLGTLGEQVAQNYLLQNGYTVLATNYRYGRAEVDIVAAIAEKIVFVEVKTRRSAAFGQPESAVSAQKQRLLYQAAVQYTYEAQHTGEIRFDIIALIIAQNGTVTDIAHFKDAFFPDWM